MFNLKKYFIRNLIVSSFLIFCFAKITHGEVDSICAKVRIQILQEASFERQAFDAKLKINNPLESINVEDIKIDVLFSDEEGNEVEASSDPNDGSAQFFIIVDWMEGIDDINGAGVVVAETSGEIHWTIIPAPGAGGSDPNGIKYFVGANITYSINGETNEFNVLPDSIFVRPMPKLVLDYFLPEDVYGDDAFTQMIEPPIPFNLGVRVKNSGFGKATNMKISSSQPEIVDNQQGLLVGFQITGSQVNNAPAELSLNLNLGTIDPGKSSCGRWIMETTLSGKFTDFSAYFTHADELGGKMTSLIDEVNTHTLVHNVIVDLPGRDVVRDFLAKNGSSLKVYESESTETVVLDKSVGTTLSQNTGSGQFKNYNLTVPDSPDPIFVSLSISNSNLKQINSATRSDGKIISLNNVWLSKTRGAGDEPWQHFLNLFDLKGGGTYTITVEDLSGTAQPPVLGFISSPKLTQVGSPVGFLVLASDINEHIENMDALPLPTAATFDTVINAGLAESVFYWTPQPGQEGIYNVNFSVSDGILHDSQNVTIIVGDENGDTNDLGILRSQQIEQFIVSSDPNIVGNNTGMVCLANNKPATTGLRVQCLAAPTSMLLTELINGTNFVTFPAPTASSGVEMMLAEKTSSANNFIPEPAYEYNLKQVYMGDDGAHSLASDTGMPGFVSAYIAATNDNYSGWMRIFSAPIITNAAFYGDTSSTNLVIKNPNELNCEWTPQITLVNIVNPAYHINFRSVPTLTNAHISGQIDTFSGAEANNITANWMMLEYKYQNSTSWNLLTTNISANGQFSTIIDPVPSIFPTNILIRARVIDEKSPTPGLPISDSYQVEIIPEPFSFLFILVICSILIKQKFGVQKY